jgi:hypothetical protein
MPSEKLSFVVTFEDGSRDIVKPVSWKNLDDVEALQTEVLKIAVGEFDGHLGSAFKVSNTAFWDLICTLGNLMPLVGKTEVGFDPRKIDDILHLTEIFITAEPILSETTGSLVPSSGNTLTPSLISRINSLNFQKLLKEALTPPPEVAKTKTKTNKPS